MKAHDSRRIVLSREVLVQIILWVGNTESFFSFLGALHNAGICGSLLPLWQLGLLYDHENLWPRLRLSTQMMESPSSRKHLEAVLKYIPSVELLWAEDIDWLCDYLAPSTILKWSAPLPVGKRECANWLAKWGHEPLKKVVRPVTKLPREVLLQIILWVEDIDSFFSFLDALHDGGICGPLLPMRQLGRRHYQGNLWPCLRLSSRIMECAWSRAHVEAILKYMPSVEILWAEDIDWLCQHLSPSTSVKWNAPLSLSIDDHVNWFAKWVQLPLRNVIQYSHPITREASPYFFAALRHCHHLVRLSLNGFLDIATVFELAASSTQLVHLDLVSYTVQMDRVVLTDSVVANAIQWLAKAPVRHFRLFYWMWDPQVNVATQQTFFLSLFRCPTLSLLDLSMGRIGTLDLTRLAIPPALRELVFLCGYLSPHQIESLAHILEGSSLQTLRIHGRTNETTNAYHHAFGKLLEAVTQSHIVKLELNDCNLNDTFWKEQNATHLQRSKLAHVSLARNRISDACVVASLAPAFQANLTLKTIRLDGNLITREGIKTLLRANQARRIRLDKLSVESRFDDENVAIELQALAKKSHVTTLELGRVRVPRG
ncbi:Aste57867_22645 [Aphanomyces stellatus]|uniref:Aste57867_22645 protein n=1 Tax=Aphanomyces stellatus TaxID=120398 RepID=A0A485LQE9_9STRA|nr:hypothetical protein As57867_022575 [Aphanomyces stellatus]VFT99299.1 Aste57867_22645 [Aphanomyces stellatus]